MSELKKYLENIRAELEDVYNGETSTEDGEPGSFWDWAADALDFEYTVDSSREYVGVKVYVTLGGPNVWVDTRRGEIGGAWGTERENIWLPSEIAEEIDNVFRELYECQ